MTDQDQHQIDQQMIAAAAAEADFNTRGRRDFDPQQHISYLEHGGKNGSPVIRTPYMQVRWRKAWFRAVYPYGDIDVQLVNVSDDGLATCRAEVTAIDTDGVRCGSASDFGQCHRNERARGGGTRETDFIQWAATRAIGRALTSLGFGIDDIDDDDRDQQQPAPRQQQHRQQQPQQPRQQPQQRQPAPVPQQQPQRPPAASQPAAAAPSAPAEDRGQLQQRVGGGVGFIQLTVPQRARIEKLAIQKGAAATDLFMAASDMAGTPITSWDHVSKRLASSLIDHLEAMPDAGAEPPPADYSAPSPTDRVATLAAISDAMLARRISDDQLSRITAANFRTPDHGELNNADLYRLLMILTGQASAATMVAH